MFSEELGEEFYTTWSFTEQMTLLDKPVYSVLRRDELDALLTPAGAVWFLREYFDHNHMVLEKWIASRLYEAGTPWPLRPDDDDLSWAEGVLDPHQLTYFTQLFQPIGRHMQIIIELQSNGWEAPNQPDRGHVKQVRMYWKQIANKTGEDISIVRHAALGMHEYYDCIHRFAKQQWWNEENIEGGSFFTQTPTAS